MVLGCAFLAAAACSNSKRKKTPVGGAGGAYDGGTQGGGYGGQDSGVDAAPEAEAAPPPPPLFFSVSPGALGQPGSGVAQQKSPQSAVYGSASGSIATTPGTNLLVVAPADLGLDAQDDLDAIAVKKPKPANAVFYFSVDAADHYFTGSDVGLEASHYRQRGDVFLSDGVVVTSGGDPIGYSGLYSNGLSVGLGSHVGAQDGGVDAGSDASGTGGFGGGLDAGMPNVDDNLDALELGVTAANAGTVYFSVDPGASGASGSAVASTPVSERGCTIYASDRDGKNRVLYSCAQIGLVPGDNVDALAVIDTGSATRVYFSIDETSVGASNTAVHGQTQGQGTAYRADIFSSEGNSANQLAIDAAGLELNSSYDVDALAIRDEPRPAPYVSGQSCTLSPSPLQSADGGITYSSYVSAHLSGNIELVYAMLPGVGNLVSAYDLSTCQRVGQPVAASGGNFYGQLVAVPGSGWSAANPLSNLDLWDVSVQTGSVDLTHLDLATGQALDSYSAMLDGYVYPDRVVYLPGTHQFALIGTYGLALVDVPTGGASDGGSTALPSVLVMNRYCPDTVNAVGSDPAGGFIEVASIPDTNISPPDSRVCRLRLDGYPAGAYQMFDPGSADPSMMGGVIVPGQAMYLLQQQNNDIVEYPFAPPSTPDGGAPDAGGG